MWQVVLFIAAWLLVLVWCLVGNYAYFKKVQPGLSRAGLDSSTKFLPRNQLKQIDQFLAQGAPGAQDSWVHGFLLHIRKFAIVALLALLAMFVAILGLRAQQDGNRRGIGGSCATRRIFCCTPIEVDRKPSCIITAPVDRPGRQGQNRRGPGSRSVRV